MLPRIDGLLARIAQLEEEVEAELNRARDTWRYRVEAGRVRFEHDLHLAHTRLKQGIPAFIRDSRPLNVIAAPLIYSMIVPIALLDLWISVYQAVSCPMLGIARVRRSAYVVMDRHHLAYLNVIEKLNCAYCGYANGVFAYVREVAGRTEQYWCPIRHAKRVRAPHRHYHEFVEYGDAKGYQQRLPLLRHRLKRPDPPDDA